MTVRATMVKPPGFGVFTAPHVRLGYNEGMRIGPAGGAHLTLDPLRYEYPELADAATDDGFDANWRVIGRQRMSGHGPFATRAFLPPRRDLSQWLRRVSTGDVDPLLTLDECSRHVAAFTEPNIAFSLAARTRDRLVLRAHLSLESGPPWRSSDDDACYEPYVIDLDVSVDELREAAATWDRELEAFPVRGSV